MLYNVFRKRYVRTLPHEAEFNIWRRNLSDTDYDAVCIALLQHFDDNEVSTSSWIPGNDWIETVYEPLYRACGNNVEASGLFFGLIVFKLLMENTDDVWGFVRAEEPIKGKTYFRLNTIPA